MTERSMKHIFKTNSFGSEGGSVEIPADALVEDIIPVRGKRLILILKTQEAVTQEKVQISIDSKLHGVIAKICELGDWGYSDIERFVNKALYEDIRSVLESVPDRTIKNLLEDVKL